jgi:hypothetical protein
MTIERAVNASTYIKKTCDDVVDVPLVIGNLGNSCMSHATR